MNFFILYQNFTSLSNKKEFYICASFFYFYKLKTVLSTISKHKNRNEIYETISNKKGSVLYTVPLLKTLYFTF